MWKRAGLVACGFEALGWTGAGWQAAVIVFLDLNREQSFVELKVWLRDPLKL